MFSPVILASGVIRGGIILGLIAIGCFSLTAKAFSEKGLPFTHTTNITGAPAKVIGVFTALLGLGLSVAAVGAMIASTQTGH